MPGQFSVREKKIKKEKENFKVTSLSLLFSQFKSLLLLGFSLKKTVVHKFINLFSYLDEGFFKLKDILTYRIWWILNITIGTFLLELSQL